MATSSITRPFVIKDKAAWERLQKALREPASKEPVTTNHYEEGRKKLEQYFGR